MKGVSVLRHRRNLLLVLVAAAVLFAALSIFWMHAAEQLSTGIDDWRRAQQEKGYAVEYQGPEITGYPDRLRVQILAPHIDSPRNWDWTGPALTGAASLFDPFTIDIDFPGAHRFQAAHADRVLRGAVTAAAARARIELKPGGAVKRAQVDLANIEITAEKLLPLRLDAFSGSIAPVPAGGAGNLPGLDLTTTANGIALPQGKGHPFGDRVEKLSIETTLLGNLPAGEPRKSLPAWRDSGGHLLIRNAHLVWGQLELRADGELRLDAQLRPAGQLTALVSGAGNTVDTLVELGVLKPEAGLGVRLALMALGKRRQIAGRSVIELPVTLRDGRLFLGPVPLLRLPPLF